ncbi:hypothetical protein GH714_028585 [Hevea brasiliensis]|uniref:Uncharacterized protein n=1 Tax=Hevea brasiliensis TaxID=3981 RepID=A0A6A6LN34_HEVBR|nr:hypothetical protein GH714_028585 [Hevea brasiliensis]
MRDPQSYATSLADKSFKSDGEARRQRVVARGKANSKVNGVDFDSDEENGNGNGNGVGEEEEFDWENESEGTLHHISITNCIALYQQLEKQQPNLNIQRQAADLRYILRAPKLRISQEEMVIIPLNGSSYDR